MKPHKHWNGGALWGSRTERGPLIGSGKPPAPKYGVSVNDR